MIAFIVQIILRQIITNWLQTQKSNKFKKDMHNDIDTQSYMQKVT